MKLFLKLGFQIPVAALILRFMPGYIIQIWVLGKRLLDAFHLSD